MLTILQKNYFYCEILTNISKSKCLPSPHISILNIKKIGYEERGNQDETMREKEREKEREEESEREREREREKEGERENERRREKG